MEVPEADHTWIVITGNPVEGFSYHGPYPTEDAAEDAKFTIEGNGGDWCWVGKLYTSHAYDD